MKKIFATIAAMLMLASAANAQSGLGGLLGSIFGGNKTTEESVANTAGSILESVLGTVISAPVKDVRRAEEAPAPAPVSAPVTEPATEPAAESGAEPVIDGSVKESAPEVPPPSGELPGQEPVILLGPPRDYAPEPGQKPAIRQPRFDRSILGEETDGEEAQVPDDRE